MNQSSKFQQMRLQEAQQECIIITDDIAKIKEKLTTAITRRASLHDSAIPLRSRSRRIVPTLEGRQQAIAEVETYIYTLELKLAQLQRQLSALTRQIHSLTTE